MGQSGSPPDAGQSGAVMTCHHFENENEAEYEAGGSGGIVGSKCRWELAATFRRFHLHYTNQSTRLPA
jgi:hypothetical protein